jgi:hypothetical protein
VARPDETPEARARRRAKYLTDLMWHAGTFFIINAFLWILDFAGGGGLDWAYWVTIGWGIGLAFHTLAYLVDGRDVEARKTRQYLDETRRSDDGS